MLETVIRRCSCSTCANRTRPAPTSSADARTAPDTRIAVLTMHANPAFAAQALGRRARLRAEGRCRCRVGRGGAIRACGDCSTRDAIARTRAPAAWLVDSSTRVGGARVELSHDPCLQACKAQLGGWSYVVFRSRE